LARAAGGNRIVLRVCSTLFVWGRGLTLREALLCGFCLCGALGE
jgi:hypothetical protein